MVLLNSVFWADDFPRTPNASNRHRDQAAAQERRRVRKTRIVFGGKGRFFFFFLLLLLSDYSTPQKHPRNPYSSLAGNCVCKKADRLGQMRLKRVGAGRQAKRKEKRERERETWGAGSGN